MTAENFITTYHPIQNPFDVRALFNGYAFDTLGQDDEFVRDQEQDTVWTGLEDAQHNIVILPGYHLQGRLFFLITEKPWRDENIKVIYLTARQQEAMLLKQA